MSVSLVDKLIEGFLPVTEDTFPIASNPRRSSPKREQMFANAWINSPIKWGTSLGTSRIDTVGPRDLHDIDYLRRPVLHEDVSEASGRY